MGSPPPLGADSSLFLDLDGTLLDLVDRPDEVRADEALIGLLQRLSRSLEGRVMIVSGRSIAQLDDILGDSAAALGLAGSHGSEHRWDGVHHRPERPPALDRAAERMRPFAAATAGVLLEEKSLGVALHYRMAPSAEPLARALAGKVADECGLAVQPGKMMVELRVAGGGKGKAIAAMMRRPELRGTIPVFAGDDVTDEDGFVAVKALGGYGVLVGPERDTAARYRLEDPAALRQWLERGTQ